SSRSFTTLFSLSLLPPPPRSPLFPYTTLFRSWTPRAGFEPAAYSLGGQPGRERRARPVTNDLQISRFPFFPCPPEPVEVQSNVRSEEHTSELQSRSDLVCRLLLEKKKKKYDLQ